MRRKKHISHFSPLTSEKKTMKNDKNDEQIRIVKKDKDSLTVSRRAFESHYKRRGYKESDGFPEMKQETATADEKETETKTAVGKTAKTKDK